MYCLPAGVGGEQLPAATAALADVRVLHLSGGHLLWGGFRDRQVQPVHCVVLIIAQLAVMVSLVHHNITSFLTTVCKDDNDTDFIYGTSIYCAIIWEIIAGRNSLLVPHSEVT